MLDRRRQGEDCLSDRALDMMMAGELSASLKASATRHLPACPACQARLRELEVARAGFSREAPSFAELVRETPTVHPPRRWWGFAGALGTAAVAAVLVLVSRVPSGGDDVRTKGGDRLGFFVEHAGAVREGISGEVVQPGDRLQLVYSTNKTKYLVIFAQDEKGTTSVIFPHDALTAKIEPGRETSLPYSLELDGAAGRETLHGVFCDRALAIEPLRQNLERHRDGTVWPSECHADIATYSKRP